MTQKAYTLESRLINGKQFLVPNFNLYDCEKYMLPKLDNAPVHHTFFQPKEIETVYKEMNIDVEQLNHNLDKSQIPDKISFKKSEDSKVDLSLSSIGIVQQSDSSMMSDFTIQKKQRPALRQSGFTHFIHLPLWDALKDVYENQIVPRIDEEDRDLLVPLEELHMTIMVFKLRKQEDLPLWQQVLKSAKKPKLSIKGVNIFPVKKSYSKVLFLNIKGAQDLIDRIVSKAVQLKLVQQSDLSHIKFDKISQTYKSEPHISLLRTKGEDLFDFTNYLKGLSRINVPKVTASEVRISVIGSHNGKDYFNEQIQQI